MTNEAGTDKSSIDPTVLALGKLSKAMETVERARGHLYSFHQLTGEADFQVGTAVVALREAGQSEVADRLERELIGLNVLFGRWTFQVVDEFDDGYYRIMRDEVTRAHSDLGVERHAYEEQLKRLNVTVGKPGHELTPDSAPNG